MSRLTVNRWFTLREFTGKVEGKEACFTLKRASYIYGERAEGLTNAGCTSNRHARWDYGSLGLRAEEVDSVPHVVVLVEEVERGQVRGLRAEFFPVFNYVIFPFPPIVGV